MSEPSQDLIVERRGGVMTITLNRPEKKNAVTPQMWAAMAEAFRDAARDPDARVVVVTGAGGAFCSGADLTAIDDIAGGGLARMRNVGAAAQALHDLPKPTIAKVTGIAAGAGANLALGCDLIVASEEARFSEIFSARSLSLDFGGSWILPRLVGLHRAKELAFFAEILSAEEAQDLGLVNRVVAAGDIDAFVDDWAGRLAAGPPIALSLTKHMLNASAGSTMAEALEREAQSQVINFGTEDLGEAMRAFIEKRAPQFKGR
jgi:enoyl-CoA hydratase/carnithine racemase